MLYSQLVNHIMEYESDTYAGNPSRKRAGLIAQKCLTFFVNNWLDGCLLTSFHQEVMEDEKEKREQVKRAQE